ncbi:MAG: PLP-dependent aminotransferase family protein [Prolixibacteraceae bacterium]|jgi:2-aminoadipate transaminase|nr:PLP-dependent aminotransferase family protein [Prolixibacteraceae bacterium]
MNSKHATKFSGNFHNIPKSFIREILNLASQKNMISFAGGLPNPSFFPNKILAESANEVLSKKGNEVLQYAGSQGHYPLREWIAKRYSEKYQMNINANNIVITNGSQQTIDVVGKMFLNKGDGVIIEKPTYLGGIQALSGYSPEFLEVDLLNDGPNIEQIEKYCLNHVPKFMYSIPNFQNPTGICYSAKKRVELAGLLQQYNLLLLEDDPYNEVQFSSSKTKPIFSLSPENVVWSGSFSKMVAPGLRMGWVILPDTLVQPFIKTKQSSDLHSNNLSQYILHHYLTNNSIDLHLQNVREAYKKQCEFMQLMIRTYFPKEVIMTSPEGGMFIWLSLPQKIDSEKLAYTCIEKGVAFVPGKSFYTSKNNYQNIRMNFSNCTFDKIEKGVKIIANEIIKELSKKVSLLI